MKKDIKAELIKMVTEKMATSQRLPWDSGLLNNVLMPVNAKTMKEYRGINMIILSFLGAGETSEYVTFNQCQELGGKIKKGAKSLPIIYWNRWNKAEKRPAEEGDNPDDCYAFLKFYNVFEVMAQTEGLERKRQVITRDNQPLEEAEAFINAFAQKTGVTMDHESTTKPGKGSAYYIPSRHLVQVPPREEFKNTEAYVATCFHELVHSTAKEMGRKASEEDTARVSYSKEEIVAEFGAALLCRQFGITSEDDNTAAYLQGWSEAIKENPDWLINGANAAQKAIDYMNEIVAG